MERLRLESITIPEGVESIGDSAFSGCSGLESITIPEGVESIGDSAFSGCSRLENVTIPESVVDIGSNPFYDTKWLEICREKNSLVIVNGILIDGATAEGNVKIPEGVESIGDSAFSGCSELENVTIPESVTSIGDSAFGSCSSLERVTIPESVTSIGDSAFWSCSSLERVTILGEVQNIGYMVFSGCISLNSVRILGNINSIKPSTFSGCNNLKVITIPESVMDIEDAAFGSCHGLSDVYYTGSEEEWKQISISDYHNYDLYSAMMHFNAVAPEVPEDSVGGGTPDIDAEDGNGDGTPSGDAGDGNGDGTPSGDAGDGNGDKIPKNIRTIKVAASSMVYNGKLQKPAVTVTDTNGQIVDASNYTVTYVNNKNVGQATITVTGTGGYTGTLSAHFTIIPKGTTLSKVTAKKKAITVKWKKQTKQTTGYQIQYSTNKKFKGAKNITIKKNKTTSSIIKKLKAKKKYFVRIRTYKTVKIDGKSTKLYSDWSKAKSVKTKK